MKKKVWLFGLSLASIIIGLLLTGCREWFDVDPDPNEEPKSNGEIDYSSFSPASIYVKNNTGKKLVAFKGTIAADTLISGVPASAGNHGLKLVSSLFQTTSDFALVLITEAQYLAHRADLETLENEPFTRIYAFYNSEGTNDTVYEISSKVGGGTKLTLHNNTAYNVEVHRNSPSGEVLGYVSPYTMESKLFLQADDYILFPVFKKFSKKDNEIYSTVPKFQAGGMENKPYFQEFALDEDQAWNLTQIFTQNPFTLSTGGAQLIIHNISSTAVRFNKGNTELLTTTGLKGIKGATTQAYTIDFPKNPDGTYAPTQLVAGYSVGSTANPISIPEFIAKVDTTYHVYIGGTNASTLELRDATLEGTYTDVTTGGTKSVGEGAALDLEKIFEEGNL
ncbi:MAG: hypothetical protein LBL76_01685 [Treponema sp.]|jgi:hypothetical protein|nr:hypothetical protein [Treponema sp.]